MNDKEFNLLDERWILVRRNDCSVEEVSLTDAILRSHEYVELAGELPTQDVSILRLMLALLHTIFSRYSPDGEKRSLERPQDALRCWSELWRAGRFPEKPVREYLESVHERFWLFHPERPFYQTMAAKSEKTAADFPVAKLNSAISESNNKVRLFASRASSEKTRLTYAEAARWLLHINSFDDGSNERGKKIDVHIGVAWLGNLGVIHAKGNNLFEELMLNLIMFNRSLNRVWDAERPVWEDEPNCAPRVEIPKPDTLSALYSLQSRRIALLRENGYVSGCKIYGGDYFSSEDAFIEPMTIWGINSKAAKAGAERYIPKTHDKASQMWREFSSCFTAEKGIRRPGVVDWIDFLRANRLIEKSRLVSFKICSVQYDIMKSCFVNVFSDSITFHTDLLTELGKRWQTMISEEIANCDELAKAVSTLARRIELAAGSSDDTAGKRASVGYAREQFYYEIDVPFREWLASIDPNWERCSDEESASLKNWHDTAKMIAASIGKSLVESAGTAAIVGRMGKDEKGNERYYSAADAYRKFRHKVNSIYSTGGEQ